MIWVAFVFDLRLGCTLFSSFPTSVLGFWTKHNTSVNQPEFLHILFPIMTSAFQIPLLPLQSQSVQRYFDRKTIMMFNSLYSCGRLDKACGTKAQMPNKLFFFQTHFCFSILFCQTVGTLVSI